MKAIVEAVGQKIVGVYVALGVWIGELVAAFDAVPVERVVDEVSGWVLSVSGALAAAWYGVVRAVRGE